MSQLALIYMDEQSHEKAIDLLEKVLKNNIYNFGEDNVQVAITQLNLASAYAKKSNPDFQKAIPLGMKSEVLPIIRTKNG